MGVVVPFDPAARAAAQDEPESISRTLEPIAYDPPVVRRTGGATRIARFAVGCLHWTVFFGVGLARGPVYLVAFFLRYPLLIATVVAFIAAPTHRAAWSLLFFTAVAFGGPILLDLAIVAIRPKPAPARTARRFRD